MKKLLIFFTLFLSFLTVLQAASINLVVFSYNRPAQLYAFLESFTKYTVGCNKISVIYKTDTSSYDDGYAIVQQHFPQVNFIQQSKTASNDFKHLTLKAIDFDAEKYIIFAVDDIIVTRPVDFNTITQLLETVPCAGFYLRLGKNITECYSENKTTGKPDLKEIAPGILSWNFKEGKGDWGYPHTVDMTVYKKSDLKKYLFLLNFNNPNLLEGYWASQPVKHPVGLCHKHSSIVNCPLNRVQNVWQNRHSNAYSPEELLELFLNGYKIDIAPLQNCENKAPHMDYQPTFVPL